MFLRCTLIFICLSFSHIVNGSDNFHEELLLKRLNNAHVYSYFQFSLFWANNLDYDSFKHPHLFSLSLGQIIERYNVRELHVSLTEGFWRYKQWGYPVVDASPGAEILAWFKDDTENVDQIWRDLVNALSGLLCASLNFINEINSMAPNFSFRLKGVNDKSRNINDWPFGNNSYIRYSTLPREIVCTENLTPWKKLLPCHTSGLITLLNARQIHNTDYHSLGIHFRHVCMDADCQMTGVELRLTVSLVFDLMLLAGNQRDWSIRKLFGNAIIGLCSVSRSTNVYLDVTSNKTDSVFLVNKQPTSVIEYTHGTSVTKYAVYNITSSPGFKFNLEVYYDLQGLPINDIPPILYANRYFAGYGHEYGKIVTEIHNNYADPVKIVYFENIPWYLPIYYQTLTITCNGETVKPLKTFYKPGKSRTRPYYLEVLLELPGNSVTKVSIQFEYVFLKWQEYPPDANHGFYIGSATITAYLPKNNENFTVLPPNQNYYTMSSSDGNYNLVEMRTEILIITLPTPDFSMPYNVICLACTVVALAFGPIHNITTKKLMFKNALKKRGIKKLVYNVFTFIKKIIFAKSSMKSG